MNSWLWKYTVVCKQFCWWLCVAVFLLYQNEIYLTLNSLVKTTYLDTVKNKDEPVCHLRNILGMRKNFLLSAVRSIVLPSLGYALPFLQIISIYLKKDKKKKTYLMYFLRFYQALCKYFTLLYHCFVLKKTVKCNYARPFC